MPISNRTHTGGTVPSSFRLVRYGPVVTHLQRLGHPDRPDGGHSPDPTSCNLLRTPPDSGGKPCRLEGAPLYETGRLGLSPFSYQRICIGRSLGSCDSATNPER